MSLVIYSTAINGVDYREGVVMKPSRGTCNEDWISLNLLNLYSNISVLVQILVTVYKEIRKILGNQDSANPWILNNHPWILNESIGLAELTKIAASS